MRKIALNVILPIGGRATPVFLIHVFFVIPTQGGAPTNFPTAHYFALPFFPLVCKCGSSGELQKEKKNNKKSVSAHVFYMQLCMLLAAGLSFAADI